MLNKHNLAIAKLSGSASNYNLDSVRVTKSETMVSDGRVLMRVTRPTPGEEEFLIDGDFALKIAEALPERYEIRTEVKDGEATLTAADETCQQIFKRKITGGRFPDVDKAMPEGEPIAEVIISLNLLIPLLKELRRFQDTNSPNVLLSIYGADKQIRLDAVNYYTGQKACALIMPIKFDTSSVRRDYPTSTPANEPESGSD